MNKRLLCWEDGTFGREEQEMRKKEEGGINKGRTTKRGKGIMIRESRVVKEQGKSSKSKNGIKVKTRKGKRMRM